MKKTKAKWVLIGEAIAPPPYTHGKSWTLLENEALPGVLGNRGNRAFISGEQGNKGQILRGTGEQRQYWGTRNIKKHIFDFWGTGEQANLFQGNKGTGVGPPQDLWKL